MGTNTGIGIGIGIPFKNNALGGDKPYFPPELKARMIGVWTNYGKKNTDADRNIIKNKIPNAGGDLEILNAAYKLNSGFGKYSEDFTTWTKSSKITSVDSESFDFVTNVNWNLLYYKSNIGKDIPSFKVHIKLKGEGKVFYNYITSEGVFTNKAITSEEYVVPISYNTKYTGETPVNCGFSIGITSEECSGTITQIPNFEDAFVTDGINDMIISQKTLQEMGVTKELTIVSMIHQISWRGSASVPLTNYIRPKTNEYVRSHVSNIGKTGIYGYVCYNISNSGAGNSHVVNTILGDKNDYSINIVGDLSQGKFSVQGYIDGNGNILETSSVAHYWTFAVLGKATEDEINLIIGNYNLDRSLKPDILCNIGKQGITNDNHAEFNDKLVDYSGNGRDVQMNNLAWKGGSGVAAKPYETFKDWTSESSSTSIITQIDEFTRIVESTTNGYWVSRIRRDSDLDKVYSPINVYLYQDNNFLVHECKYEVDGVKYTIPINEPVGKGYHKLEMYTKDRYTELPENAENVVLSEWYFLKSTKGSIKYSIIPSCKGGILLDGINDFGKVTGMPVYKDYTVVTDREIFANIGAISSKNNPGAFVETAGNSVYSFGQATSGLNFISTRSISYLSKYSYCGQSITAGAAEDGTDMWLGTIRDNDSRFFNGAIYSLMTFPYSMSEFLIERQLKKHKLGTLYPNMVEFRPVIKSSVELVNKPTFAIRGTSTLLNAGDYIPENSEIWVVITMNNAADRITKFVINGNTIDIPSSAYNPSTMKYGFPFTIDNKSPQKITMTIEQDENYVQWNPVVTSNVEYIGLDFYLNNYQKRINVGDYIPKDAYVRANFYLKNNVDELTIFTFNGVNIDYKRSVVDDTAFNIGAIYNYDSPQEVNITVDEYIRYEDIVQPYPVVFQIKDRNTNQIYSWGDKIKVGSSIQLTQGENPNLLSGLYSVQSYEYEGKTYSYNQLTKLNIILTKQSISLSCNKIWLLDDNEPKCILSPSRLRIPNSSYKLLGYIPDISGHGNHGKINNSAYAGMSGVNGYPVVFGANKTWANESSGYVTSITNNTIHITNVLNAGLALLYSYVKYNGNLQNIKEIPPFRIEIKGLEGRSKFIYKYLATSDATKETNLYLGNGTHELPKSFLPTEALINNAVVGFSISPIEEGVTNFLSDITIKVLPEYDGAYCLDGVDDFVTIPTLSSGGKQVLMKVNWQSIAGTAILYDQRTNGGFAIFNRDFDTNENKVPAYRARNIGGSTYIDGILNEYIYASQLKDTTHNIVELYDPELNIGTLSPRIGYSYLNSNYSQMSLYDFMLFDEISTDDKIQELNKYVGIEAKVELPPYYWDTYGKTNSDEDKATIQQRGIAVGDYDLTNYNHAYEGMSGYNGYPIILSGTNRTYQDKASYVNVVGDDKNVINLTRISFNTAAIFSYVKQNGELTSYNKYIESFKIKVTGIDYSRFVIKYSYISEANATAKTTMTIASDGIYELPKSFASDGSLTSSDIWIGINFTKQSNDMPDIIEDVNVTIEVLPEYENGLAYDGVEDYSKNANIPAFTDYTYIYKRTIINIPTNAATLLKGADKTNGGAFIADYGNKWQFNFGQYNTIQSIVDGINWQTVNSFNGTSINKGENTDDSGITVSKFSSGYASTVFYKLILYPKTISLLEINFLKNLMEKDEIIDLTNPIFIKDE